MSNTNKSTILNRIESLASDLTTLHLETLELLDRLHAVRDELLRFFYGPKNKGNKQ